MTSGPLVYPGGSNTYVKNHEATGNLVVEYSRNPDDFMVNKYIQITDVKKDSGYFLSITPEEAARVLSANLDEFVWPDGAPRPQRNSGTETFNFTDYHTERYDYDFTLGDKSAQQADWDIVQTHTAIKAQQAMTARTVAVHGLLSTDATWPTGHRSTVATIPGNTGNWEQSTVVRQDIKRSISYAIEVIMLATLSMVRRKDLILVLGPDVAHRMSESQEIVDHIKGSPDAYNQVVGNAGKWGEYQLPDKIYGVQVVVEDATRVTNKRGAARATSWVANGSNAYLLARPGQLVSPGGGPSWSTVHLFIKEDMSVETRRNEDDRRTEGHVVDDFDVVATAPSSGFNFEDTIGAA